VINEKLGFAVEYAGLQWDGEIIIELLGHMDQRKVLQTYATKLAFGVQAASHERRVGGDKDFVDLLFVWEPPVLEIPGQEVSGLMEQPLGGLFSAFEQFVGKLPNYAAQVQERLKDNDKDSAFGHKNAENMDWRGVHKAGHLKGKTKRDRKGRCLCPLACSDGSGLQRYMRFAGEDQDEGVVENQRTLNFAKAQRVAADVGNATARYQANFAISVANFFIRAVSDVVALWSIYHADAAHWDGQCTSLKPRFRLPYELSNKDDDKRDRQRVVHRSGRKLSVQGAKMRRVKDASEKDHVNGHILEAEEYNPFDHWPWI
jgi:hypothetical protein